MTTPSRLPDPYGQGQSANLADILERVLDKGVVIAGDIRINLLDIELLTIKLRLVSPPSTRPRKWASTGGRATPRSPRAPGTTS